LSLVRSSPEVFWLQAALTIVRAWIDVKRLRTDPVDRVAREAHRAVFGITFALLADPQRSCTAPPLGASRPALTGNAVRLDDILLRLTVHADLGLCVRSEVEVFRVRCCALTASDLAGSSGDHER
jgi:hypothetical protein